MNTTNNTDIVPTNAIASDTEKGSLKQFMSDLESIVNRKSTTSSIDSNKKPNVSINNGTVSFTFNIKSIHIDTQSESDITDIRFTRYSMLDYFKQNSIALTPSNIIGTLELYLETQESVRGSNNSFPETVKTRHIVTYEVYRILGWASVAGIVSLSYSTRDPYFGIICGAVSLPIPYIMNKKKQKLKILKYLREKYPKTANTKAWFNKEHSESGFW